MRKLTMRGAAVLMTAAIAVTCLTGCAGNGGSSNNGGGKKGSTLEVSLDHAYAGEKLNVQGVENPQGGMMFGDKVLIIGVDDNYQEIMALYDPATDSTQTVEFAYPKSLPENSQAYPSSYFLDSDGNFDVVFNGYTYSTAEDGEEGEDDYQDLGMTLEVYDKDFNVVETRSLKDVFGEETYINSIVPNPAGGYLISQWDNETGNVTLGFYDADFKKTGDVKGNFQHVERVLPSKDGTLYLNYYDTEGMSQFGMIDAASGAVTPVTIEGMPQWINSCIESHDDKYDLYMYDSEYIYGVDAKGGKCEPVLNWLNSDFMGNYVGEVVQLTDGRFMLSSTSMGKDAQTEVWVLSPRDPDDFKNVKLLSMAALYLPDETAQAVLEFNRTHNDIRIAVANYEKYSTDEDYNAGLEKFKSDMTSGIVADLILTSGLPYESFAGKGLFLDLTDRISTFTEEDYFLNYFDALKYGDKLYQMGFSFNVQTLEGKEELVGSKQGLTAAEFMQLIKNLPAGTKAFGDMSKEGALSTLVSMNIASFTDRSAGTCTFDSPEFIEMLEFCDTFPSSEEIDRMYQDENYDWAEQQYQYINGKTAFEQCWLNNVRYAYQDRMTNFDKAKVTRVGYPVSSKGGNGGIFGTYDTLAISANTQYQDECWEFLSSMLSEDYQESLDWSFPVSRKAFAKMVEEAMKPETYTDPTGKEVKQEFTIWRGEEEIKVPDMPKSFADELETYIQGIRDINYYDTTLMEMIDEEAGKFFSGDQNAQQASNMIQSRASLYLSEQA